MQAIFNQTRRVRGQGLRKMTAVPSNTAPARTALIVAKRIGETSTRPTSIKGKHNAQRKNTRNSLARLMMSGRETGARAHEASKPK